MSLDLDCAFLKEFPILAVLQARLHEDAILVSREVLPADDLANEVDFRFKVCAGASIASKLLHLVHLLLCQIAHRLLSSFLTMAEELIGLLNVLVLIVLAWYVSVMLMHVCCGNLVIFIY